LSGGRKPIQRSFATADALPGFSAVLLRSGRESMGASPKGSVMSDDERMPASEIDWSLWDRKKVYLRDTLRWLDKVKRQERAWVAGRHATRIARRLRGDGLSHRQIADELNRLGLVTTTGRYWTRQQVSLLLSEIDK